MSTKLVDLFGKRRVIIEGNPSLEGMAERILALVNSRPELLSGSKVGMIDRQIRSAIWEEDGMEDILSEPNEDVRRSKWAEFWLNCSDPELINRARRWLVEHDEIHLPAVAIRAAEQQRSRLSSAFRR